MLSYSKRDQEVANVGLFRRVDKTIVLQEARVFNSSPIHVGKCRLLLAKIVYLLHTNEPFTVQEGTDLFFNVIKLFQSKDTSLRQLMYLVIKELSGIAQDVIMVTQSLIKDIQSKQEIIYRANAIRALCLITDHSMIQGIERILKASIIDKSPSVSSAALVSSYHLCNVAKDIIKRWTNEVQESIGMNFSTSNYFTVGQKNNQHIVISTSHIHEYHAISLLYLIKQHDRMAITKLVANFSAKSSNGFLSHASNTLKNPLAICMLIRFASKVMQEDPGSFRKIYELLEGFLRYKSDMVNLEAARGICDIPNMTLKDLYPAVSVLQVFLTCSKPTLRFAAIRTLNQLAYETPAAVSAYNLDIEKLIKDSNRSVATFAITTLLKTSNEGSVDRLMKQISSFINNNISDEFKIIVVEAIRAFCLKFPNQQVMMLTFLSHMLRDEGSYPFKRAVVESIFDMVKHIPECKETALSHLCEFIEDCEFTKLSVRILYLLGLEGPNTMTATKYIRYIYNRVILENSVIRAAAVSALAKFGVYSHDLTIKKSVHVLLTRCLDDVDDEVRDRATLYLAMMNNENLAKKYIADDTNFALSILERQLVEYIHQPADKEFNLYSVPVISKSQEQEGRRTRANDPSTPLLSVSSQTPASEYPHNISKMDQQEVYAEKLSSHFSSFGPLFKSSRPIALTETETEYLVTCIKHTFTKHLVFQFNCTNTLNDQLLENVQMVMQPKEEGLIQIVEILAEKLEYDVTNIIYVAFEQEDPEAVANVTFTNTLRFFIKDCDPTTSVADPERYQDEYQIEDIEVNTSDYIRPCYTSDFEQEYETMKENEMIDTFALDKDKTPNLKAACTSIIELLDMQALEGTEFVKNNHVHTLLLSGTFLDGSRILVKCRMTFNTSNGVAFELAVRSQDEIVSQIVLLAIS